MGRGGSLILLNDHAHDSDNDDKRMMMSCKKDDTDSSHDNNNDYRTNYYHSIYDDCQYLSSVIHSSSIIHHQPFFIIIIIIISSSLICLISLSNCSFGAIRDPLRNHRLFAQIQVSDECLRRRIFLFGRHGPRSAAARHPEKNSPSSRCSNSYFPEFESLHMELLSIPSVSQCILFGTSSF